MDIKRQLIDLNLTVARSYQSSETGFIHIGDLIPFYENFCYILALFRSRIGDNIQEAKELLSRLLCFQIPMGRVHEGLFPRNLHEYPEVKDTRISVHLLPIFYAIEKEYLTIIENPLKEQLKNAFERISEKCQRIHSEFPFKTPLSLKLLAVKGVSFPTDFEVKTTREWTDLCIAMQMVGRGEEILPVAISCWDGNLHTYVGPASSEFQEKGEPEITLFDLFMASSLESPSKRLFTPERIHLEAALVFPFQGCKEKKTNSDSLFSIPSFLPSSKSQSQGFHLIRLLWGDENHIHSLVCQEKEFAFQTVEKGRYLFGYKEELPNEKDGMELNFFCDYHPEVQIFIEEKKGTVFQLGEKITIVTPSKTVTLSFSIKEGEGKFLGHISRSNRPSQIALKGPKDFTSYDWRIGLRTLSRTPNLQMEVTVTSWNYSSHDQQTGNFKICCSL